jgi:hypothetical protein
MQQTKTKMNLTDILANVRRLDEQCNTDSETRGLESITQLTNQMEVYSALRNLVELLLSAPESRQKRIKSAMAEAIEVAKRYEGTVDQRVASQVDRLAQNRVARSHLTPDKPLDGLPLKDESGGWPLDFADAIDAYQAKHGLPRAEVFRRLAAASGANTNSLSLRYYRDRGRS